MGLRPLSTETYKYPLANLVIHCVRFITISQPPVRRYDDMIFTQVIAHPVI